jgi:hypothetical protein
MAIEVDQPPKVELDIACASWFLFELFTNLDGFAYDTRTAHPGTKGPDHCHTPRARARMTRARQRGLSARVDLAAALTLVRTCKTPHVKLSY